MVGGMESQLVNEPFVVGVNRRLAFAAAVFFGFLFFGAVGRGVSTGNAESTVIAALFIGLPFIFYVRRAFQRSPVLVLDGEYLRNIKANRTVRWEKIGGMYLCQRQGIFGEYHHLVFADRATDKSEDIPLDQLSVNWKDIVELVEHHAGRPVPVRREAGLRIRRSSI